MWLYNTQSHQKSMQKHAYSRHFGKSPYLSEAFSWQNRRNRKRGLATERHPLNLDQDLCKKIECLLLEKCICKKWIVVVKVHSFHQSVEQPSINDQMHIFVHWLYLISIYLNSSANPRASCNITLFFNRFTHSVSDVAFLITILMKILKRT